MQSHVSLDVEELKECRVVGAVGIRTRSSVRGKTKGCLSNGGTCKGVKGRGKNRRLDRKKEGYIETNLAEEQYQGLRITIGCSRCSFFNSRAIDSLPARRLILSLYSALCVGFLVLDLAVPIIIDSVTLVRCCCSVRRRLSTRSRSSPFLCPSTSLQDLLPVPGCPLILQFVAIKQLVLAEWADPFVCRVRQCRLGGSNVSVPVSFSPRRKAGR